MVVAVRVVRTFKINRERKKEKKHKIPKIMINAMSSVDAELPNCASARTVSNAARTLRVSQ